MHADLVGATGLRTSFNQGKFIPTLQNGEFRAGGAAFGMGHLLDPHFCIRDDFAAAPERLSALEGLGFWPPVDDGAIGLSGATRLKRFVQGVGGGVILRYENDAGGLAIETIDDRKLGAIRDFVEEELTQAFEKTRRVAGLPCVDLERRGFIDDDQVV